MGVRSIALNPALSGAEVVQIIEASKAKGLVVDASFPEVAAAAGGTPIDLRVAVGGSIEGYTSYDDLVAGCPTTVPADRTFGSPISYSSGTTGKPTGIRSAERRGEKECVK